MPPLPRVGSHAAHRWRLASPAPTRTHTTAAPATDTRLRRIASLSQHNRSLRRVALLTLLLGDKLKRLGAS